MDEQLFNKLVSIRRQLHQNPELGFREFKTSALVASHLRELAIPIEPVAATGLIGTLKKGEGPTIVLRADMDALPIREDTDLAFRSVCPDVMHACGHDLHTTMLLGAAHLLKDTPFEGTVKLVFQPSEEGNTGSPEKGKSGGQIIVESGKLNGASAAVCLHVHPLLPVGKLAYIKGEAFANVGNFSVRIKGNGGHPGAMEHVVDPVLIAGQLIIKARALAVDQEGSSPAVLAFTHLESLAAPSFNVIPSEVLLQGTMRAYSISVYKEMERQLEELIKELEASYKCRIELYFSVYYPSLFNDDIVQEKLADVQEKVFGKTNVLPIPARLLGEDFAFYSRAMPAQLYFLGANSEGNGSFFLHHPKVTFNEDCIPYGATFLASAATALLKSK